MKSIDKCIIKFKAAFEDEYGWYRDTNLFPEPNLIENKIYPVKLRCGSNSVARFCFGEGEYWWVNVDTGKLCSVDYYYNK